MKFQKTLLAASLAVAATAVNADVVLPTPNLNQEVGFVWAAQDGHTYSQENKFTSPHLVGVNQVTNSNTGLNHFYAEKLSQNLNAPFMPGQTGETHALDLGSKLPGSIANTGFTDDNTLVAKYNVDGKKVVEVIARHAEDAAATKSYFIEGANGKLTAIETSAVDTSKLVKENFIEGGVVSSTFNKTGTLEEIKRANNETVKYGQISTVNSQSTFDGATIAPTGTSNKFDDTVTSGTVSNTKSVEMGILTQKVLGDVTSNVYGVMAQDGAKVTSLTGQGVQTANIVLANGDIQTVDGRHGQIKLLEATNSANQLVSEYRLGSQKVWVVTDVTDQTKKYYTGSSTNLVEFTGDKNALTSANLIAGGALTTNTGVYQNASVRNVISDQKVTYSEKTFDYDASRITGQTTDANGNKVSNIGSDLNVSTEQKNQREQAVDVGIIGKNEDSSNKYGLEVSKTDANGTEKTTITSGGISTTGVINAKDYQIGGVSIVENINTTVEGAVAGATEAIDKKVAEVDTKIVEVDQRLTQFNATASELNGRVDQLNNRIDDVEKTSYRGIAIALAAQQAIPNLSAGQTAVFGGAGMYKSEGAGALGVATVLADGRTSFSGALGVAGGGEVGGRVGVAYVFGGK